jgi:hypothetical protein
MEGQVLVFISPRNRVAKLYPRALGYMSTYVCVYIRKFGPVLHCIILYILCCICTYISMLYILYFILNCIVSYCIFHIVYIHICVYHAIVSVNFIIPNRNFIHVQRNIVYTMRVMLVAKFTSRRIELHTFSPTFNDKMNGFSPYYTLHAASYSDSMTGHFYV